MILDVKGFDIERKLFLRRLTFSFIFIIVIREQFSMKIESWVSKPRLALVQVHLMLDHKLGEVSIVDSNFLIISITLLNHFRRLRSLGWCCQGKQGVGLSYLRGCWHWWPGLIIISLWGTSEEETTWKHLIVNMEGD